MSGRFRIEPLAGQDRSRFSCGSEPLDRYLRERATQDVRRRVAACFIAVPDDADAVAGYYSLAAASLPLLDLPPEVARKLPRYPAVPAARLGRLAVDQACQGLQLGAALLWDAITRSMHTDLAVFAMLVDAKDAQAAAFYEHHGFIPFSGRPLQLFLPLAGLRPKR